VDHRRRKKPRRRDADVRGDLGSGDLAANAGIDAGQAILPTNRMATLPKGPAKTGIEQGIAARIRECRAVRGLSQRQIAEIIGVSYRQMHKYERGLNRIPAGSLYEIARLLDMPIDYFYHGLAMKARRSNTPDRLTLLETTRHFSAIKNEKHLEAFSQLVRALAGR